MQQTIDFNRWGQLGRTETRRKVISQYGNRCQICRIEFNKEKKIYPHIHHKKYEYNFRIENFELLCKICHGRNHPRSKYYLGDNMEDLD